MSNANVTIATHVLLVSLVERLVAKGILTPEDVHEITQDAIDMIGAVASEEGYNPELIVGVTHLLSKIDPFPG